MKGHLRELVSDLRNNLPSGEVKIKSKQIKKNLLSLPEISSSKHILSYVSYNNEVATHELIKELLLKNKHISIPYCNIEDLTLSVSPLCYWDDLCPGAYDILEPKKECRTPIHLDSIDVMIIPGVAFDTTGNRIGHGKGYFDRLLKDVKALRIGLAFEFQIVSHVPMEPHDEKMDIIVTEKQIIRCKK